MEFRVFQIRTMTQTSALGPMLWRVTESVRLLQITESVTDSVTRVTLASASLSKASCGVWWTAGSNVWLWQRRVTRAGGSEAVRCYWWRVAAAAASELGSSELQWLCKWLGPRWVTAGRGEWLRLGRLQATAGRCEHFWKENLHSSRASH